MKSSSPQGQKPDLSEIDDERWKRARLRLEAIAPLLQCNPLSRRAVETRAKDVGKSPATIYRWIDLWRRGETVSSLLPQNTGPCVGTHRLPSLLEEVIDKVLSATRSNVPRRSVGRLAHRVTAECLRANLMPPHTSTLRRRLKVRQQQEELRRPILGSFPGADGPLAVVQIDHSKLDVVLVSEQDRRPLGRPWLTLAIDVFSRCVAGFYLSFDPPGVLSVGLCLAHAILPKDLWLAKLNIEQTWPISGLMDVVHADNGREFHSRTLDRATQEWGIGLKWRPVRQPWYGGHIERLMGTVSRELHQLPGTTMSSPDERRGYDAQKHAALTLAELEHWLVLWITGVYHKRVHREIRTSPIVRYQEGLRGCGLAPRPANDATKLHLDFMPFYERSVGRAGIRLDGIYYWSDVLKPYVEARDTTASGRRKRFPIRRDPRDVSAVWFWDTDTSTYHRIPYRNLSHPAASIWELREAYRHARSEISDRVTETDLFETYDKMQRIESAALRKARAVHRERAKLVERDTFAETQVSAASQPKPVPVIKEQISAFEEIEEL